MQGPTSMVSSIAQFFMSAATKDWLPTASKKYARKPVRKTLSAAIKVSVLNDVILMTIAQNKAVSAGRNIKNAQIKNRRCFRIL